MAVCLAVLAGCVGYGKNRLRLVIAADAVVAALDGHVANCAVFESGAADSVAWGGDALKAGASATIPMHTSVGASWPDLGWQGDPALTYELEVWIDMDDDTMGPESGVDYVTQPSRLDLVLDNAKCGTVFVVDGPFVVAP